MVEVASQLLTCPVSGNHRVIFLDATSHSTLKYVESFGVMGEVRCIRE